MRAKSQHQRIDPEEDIYPGLREYPSRKQK